MADGEMDHFYNKDKNETYEIVDAQARSDISELGSELDTKVDKVTGKGLSTNDYTTEEKIKLQGIEDNAEVANVWFCVVDEAHVNANNSHIIDIYAHTVGRRLRRSTAPRFDAGDMLRVYFNGIDVDSILPVSHTVAYRLVINEVYESGVEPTEPYGLGYDRYFFSPYSQREFTFIQSGNYLNLAFVYTQASEDMHGEISVTSSLTSNQTGVAASAYAVKRLKDLIDSISGGSLTYEVVQTLPVSDISTTTIYLVPKQTAGTQNVYDEYINPTGVPSGWEKLGDTEIDLTNYYTKTETDTLLDDKADTADLAPVATSNDYSDLDNLPTIPTNTWRPLEFFGQAISDDVDGIDLILSSGFGIALRPITRTDVDGNIIGRGMAFYVNTQEIQELLVSGTNIKTVNGNSLLGSGNITTPDTKPNSWKAAGVTDIDGTDYSAYDQNGGVSLATGQVKSVGTVNLTAGVWIVEFTVSFTANSTGYRSIGLSGGKNDSSYGGVPNRITTGNAGAQPTVLSKTILLYPSTTTRYHILAGHNAGTALTVYPRVRAIKIT